MMVAAEAQGINSVVRYLRKLGHSGRFSITAVGILSKVPKEILEAVSSSGIRLYDLAYGRKSMETHIRLFLQRNPPPTHVMLISPPRYFDLFQSSVDESNGEHVIFPFPTDSSDADAKVLWDKLLLEEDVKCSKALEPWVCPTCHVYHLQVDEEDNELEEISPEDVKCSKTFEPGNSLCWVSCEEQEEDEQEEEQDYDPEIFPERATWVCGVCVKLPGRGFENFLSHTELDQVDDLDDNPEEFHWLFRKNTVSQLTYEEDRIAEDALKILQTECP